MVPQSSAKFETIVLLDFVEKNEAFGTVSVCNNDPYRVIPNGSSSLAKTEVPIAKKMAQTDIQKHPITNSRYPVLKLFEVFILAFSRIYEGAHFVSQDNPK